MPKSRQKPARPGPAPQPARSGTWPGAGSPKINPRLQTANRWQRSKRYGWDSR